MIRLYESAPSTVAEARSRMVERQLRLRGIADRRVLAAMERVPRELFVPESLRDYAYEDGALPIGYGQTISQPFIVATICELLGLAGDERVLDVGTGSGYQAAVLAELAREVVTIERIPELAEHARTVLAAAGCGLLSADKDETAGWSAQRLYSEAKEAEGEGSWDKAAKLLEKLEARFPYGRYSQQAQLELGYVYWKAQEPASALAAQCARVLGGPYGANVALLVGAGDNGGDALAPTLVRDAHHQRVEYVGMRFQRVLHLRRSCRRRRLARQPRPVYQERR